MNTRKNLHLLCALFFLLATIGSVKTIAQSVTNYTFAASAGTFTALTTPTNPPLSSGGTDDGYFNTIPIGFDFWYMGVRYTTISASTNGWITFGVNITNDELTADIANGGSPRPVVAPLWDDLDVVAASRVSYKTTGAAGSRVFTLQWLNAKWDYMSSGNTISIQLKLYEGTGKLEFVYRAEAAALSNPAAAIGITASGTGSGNYRSLNNSGASPTVSSSTPTNNISTKPATGQTYGWTPPVPTTPTSLTFTSVSNTSMTLNWVDASTNEVGFVIYRSTDGVNYSFVSQTAAGVTSSAQSGLTISTTYYWRVYAVSEGGMGASLAGSRATTTILPLTLISFTATRSNNHTQLEWKTESEVNVSHFEVQRSDDGVRFYGIGTLPANNRARQETYTSTDNAAIQHTAWYRLLSLDNDGKQNFSKIIAVTVTSTDSELKLLTNPFQSHIVLSAGNNLTGVFEYRLSLPNGQQVQKGRLEIRNAGQHIITLPAVTSGTYILEVGNGKKQFSYKVVMK